MGSNNRLRIIGDINQIKVQHCPPGTAMGYKADFTYSEAPIGTNSPLLSQHRLWWAVLRQALIDLKSGNNKKKIERHHISSFRWLFYDKKSFPIIAEYLGFDYRNLRKKLIKYVRTEEFKTKHKF